MTFSSLFRRIASLLYVPTCVGCFTKIDEGVLCNTCKIRYGKELQTLCITCGKPYAFCSCVSENMIKAGICKHYKRLRYDPAERDAVVNRLIYQLKRHLNYELIDFLSAEMTKMLPEFHGETVVTYMPRSRAARLQHGFDQSELLGKRVAGRIGIPFLSCLRNTKGKEQKHLTKSERATNADKSYLFVGDPASIKAKTVILVDDVATTGATLAAGARLLRKNGARVVVALTLAESHRRTL